MIGRVGRVGVAGGFGGRGVLSGLTSTFAAAITGLTNNPTHGNAAQDGVALTAVASNFSDGAPASITYQWFTAAGGAISGATSATYTPDASSDDLANLYCQITADGYGSRNTPAYIVRHVPPVAANALPEADLTSGAGIQTIATAGDFTGNGLTYAVNTVPGVSIDQNTGVVSVNTGATLAAISVVVTASNSGGAVSSGFTLTVAAAATLIWGAIAGDGDVALTFNEGDMEPFDVAMGNGSFVISWTGGGTRRFAHFPTSEVSGSFPDGVTATIEEGTSPITVTATNDVQRTVVGLTDAETVTPQAAGVSTDVVAIEISHSLGKDANAAGADANSLDRAKGQWAWRIADHAGVPFAYERKSGQRSEWVIPLDQRDAAGDQDRFTATTSAGILAAQVNRLILTANNFSGKEGLERGHPSTQPDFYSSASVGQSHVDGLILMYDNLVALGSLPAITLENYDSWPKPDTQDAAGLATFKRRARGPYLAWNRQAVADVKRRRPDINVVNTFTAPLMADVMDMAELSAMTYSDWFRDDAPHGNPSAYLIAGAIQYRGSVGNVPTDYVPATTNGSSPAIHPAIISNWAAIATLINANFATVEQNRQPGPICTVGPDVTATLATASAGLTLTLTGNSIPVDLDSYEYSTDGEVTWRDLGGTTGAINITLASDGTALPINTSVDVRLRALNANSVAGAISGDDMTATTGANAGATELFTIAAGDGQITITTGAASYAADFTLTAGDAQITVVPN